ncbi:MAG: hypothetical protein LBE84_06425 [Planctomycetota bacterium]|nr:hypothetical protein [Planctomycetota bacterium]
MAEIVQQPVSGEDPPELAVRVAEKIRKSRRWLIPAVLIIAAAAAVIAYGRHAAARREAEAENAVFRSEVELATKPDFDIAVLDREASEYKGFPAGARALATRFARAFADRDYATAERSAREFISSYPKSVFISRVRLALVQALFMGGKFSEAESLLRDLIRSAGPDIFPQAKLALAQTLERLAEESVNPDEYRRYLEEAETEYNDIVVRSQISVPSQRGYWPPAVVVAADFALVAVKDRLAGYIHPAPGRPAASSLIPPPAGEDDEGTTAIPGQWEPETDDPDQDESETAEE